MKQAGFLSDSSERANPILAHSSVIDRVGLHRDVTIADVLVQRQTFTYALARRIRQ